MSGCSLETDIKMSDYGLQQLNKIKDMVKSATIGKGTIIFANLLSFFSRSSGKRALAAKGSLDWSNIKKVLSGIDKVTLKQIDTAANAAALRTTGEEHKFWRSFVQCIRTKS
ncbi:hypothetical protein [Flocculibacter collagenilyticus]|uniref:hypothetical protein n=1 Tax=Flocculibacter collagenilyticus TaxID=2744479 RepID=UPI0018F2AD40|nr:hypothetical protein [Flocculibacter collagenilyticus]